MDRNMPPSLKLEEIIEIVRELREDAIRQEHSLERIIVALQARAEQFKDDGDWAEASSPPPWRPAYGRERLLGAAQAPLKIRRIEVLQSTQYDIVTRLRNTRLGRLYRSHLKRYTVIRALAHWIWRNGYPIYMNQLAKRLPDRRKRRWRMLTKQSEFAEKHKLPVFQLESETRLETPEPKIYPACEQSCLGPRPERYIFPPISVAILPNATTYGGTNLILANGEVIFHDLYDFERDYTGEELHGRALIDPQSMCARWMLHDDAPESAPVAATFVDACASNYAHWITEVLPRMMLFCDNERFNDVPVVVNDGLHQNIMESLLLVAGEHREIITLPIGRALVVDQLHLTSVAGYVPFEQRTTKLSGHSHGLFSTRALGVLRNHLDGIVLDAEEEPWPEKIFLRRNSGARRVTNIVELEKLVVARGYVIVEPEKLTFSQQVQLFRNAKEIVGPTGAALANAIFCQPGTRVAIFMAKHDSMIYRYWSNMLGPLQVSVFYVLGNIVKNHDFGIHGDFFINPSDVIDLLGGFDKK